MAEDSFGRSGWEDRWTQVRATAGEKVGRMPPNRWLLELAGLPGPLEQLHRRLSYGRDGLPATWPAGEAGQARLPGQERAKEASASALSDRAER